MSHWIRQFAAKMGSPMRKKAENLAANIEDLDAEIERLMVRRSNWEMEAKNLAVAAGADPGEVKDAAA